MTDVLRVLLIDSYDSFTHNLASLCRRAIPNCHVYIIKNDTLTLAELLPYLVYFSAIVIGPGPGSPQNAEDVGIVKEIWKIPDEHLLPIFGVCLGLQSLAVEYGATLKRLNVVKHGQISRIQHEGIELFKGVGQIDAVRYHSLHVKLEADGEVEALAWADDGNDNGKVLMAARHRTRPFWAVQYHPESICTRGGGEEVLRNFWRLSKSWSASKGRGLRSWHVEVEAIIGPPWPKLCLPYTPTHPPSPRTPSVVTRTFHKSDLSVARICEALGVSDELSDFVLLDSASEPGRFSIIGSLSPSSPKITYYCGESHISVVGKHSSQEPLGDLDIWTWLAAYMSFRKAQGGVKNIPFWGGLVGYLSYELGVDSTTPHQGSQNGKRHPDVNLVYVERSIVLDSKSGQVYIQSLRPNDNAWLDSMAHCLIKATPTDVHTSESPSKKRRTTVSPAPPVVTLPDRAQYISRIIQAKEYLYSGDSYELCLTAPTHIAVPKPVSPSNNASSSWELYKVLRERNPAPHSAYIRLHPSTLLSSSPERFLSFSRPPNAVCQLRPIKGTVRKAPGITREIAEEALVGSTKEVAENLMIVDLIRHDLHGVVGDDVDVKQFCRVEEYETVWQLVSVIEGRLPPGSEAAHGSDINIGWEVLRRSLPPGSMTGAPKKRSVEILHDLEGKERGIYSGVFGYWCVGGGGDWSVTIRSCFKLDSTDDLSEEGRCNLSRTDNWVLGAGGAITALSDPEAEWEEMVVKVESVLRAFNTAAMT